MTALIRRIMDGLSFNFIQPQDPVDNTRSPSEIGPLALDLLNTGIAFDTPVHARHALHQMPRMSTIAIAVLINELVRSMPAGTCYLNVGVYYGYTFLAGLVGNQDRECVGVDNFSEFNSPRAEFLSHYDQYRTPHSHFFDQDYRDYLRDVHQTPLGLYFFDGPHAYADQLEALQLAHDKVAIGGYVLIDDTNYGTAAHATLDFMKCHHTDYEVVLHRSTARTHHPTFWNGIMLLHRVR